MKIQNSIKLYAFDFNYFDHYILNFKFFCITTTLSMMNELISSILKIDSKIYSMIKKSILSIVKINSIFIMIIENDIIYSINILKFNI